MSPLGERLARRIAATGPLTVADYMAAALGDPEHGYYRKADPLGAAGDFTTAPEISQLFGELIGAWLIDCWDRMGRPNPVRLIELGPGRGTLMADALRVGRHIPDWLAAIELYLVEINPELMRLQAERLSPHRPQWRDSLSAIQDGPFLLVANEFLDALPIRQLVFWRAAWRERLVDWNTAEGFHFTLSPQPTPLTMLLPGGLPAAPEGSVFEISPASIGIVAEIARRVRHSSGAALLVDYGRSESAPGETLQAVSRHRSVKVLDDPGEADLSAHVDFGILARTAIEGGAAAFGPADQGDFLRTLGIGLRAERLKSGATTAGIAAIDAAVSRLIDPSSMGALFKTLAIVTPGLVPAGFSAV